MLKSLRNKQVQTISFLVFSVSPLRWQYQDRAKWFGDATTKLIYTSLTNLQVTRQPTDNFWTRSLKRFFFLSTSLTLMRVVLSGVHLSKHKPYRDSVADSLHPELNIHTHTHTKIQINQNK